MTDADALAARIVADTGGDIRLALPLGLGKPVRLLNALTRAACEDPSIHLSIFTALTLERPSPASDIEKRFLEPAMDRLFGAYPEILYARMLREGSLPANIELREFFLLAGRWLGVERMQQNYISANYTHARDVLIAQDPNVLIQLLAREGDGYSLSCNTDITADLLQRRAAGQMDFLMAGEINDQLPFMHGPAAEIDSATLQYCLDPPRQFELFSAVRQPVSDDHHAIGAHVAGLVRDGGTLQLGIGKTGDAVAHALILRQKGRFAPLLDDLSPGADVRTTGFETGLYAAAEMLVGGFWPSLRKGSSNGRWTAPPFTRPSLSRIAISMPGCATCRLIGARRSRCVRSVSPTRFTATKPPSALPGAMPASSTVR